MIRNYANSFLSEGDGIEAIPHYCDVDRDNNRLERINRYISLSRHNSLIFDYLSGVLNKAADLQHLTPEAYRNLLPDHWTKE